MPETIDLRRRGLPAGGTLLLAADPFYFAADRGRAGYQEHMHDFAKLIWRQASPKWQLAAAPGIGHNLPQEASQAFAQAVIDVDGRPQ